MSVMWFGVRSVVASRTGVGQSAVRFTKTTASEQEQRGTPIQARISGADKMIAYLHREVKR